MNIIKPGLSHIILMVFAAGLIGGCGGKEAAKFNQYMVQGKELYKQHCSNCHQIDGTGLAKLIPPLKDSDYLQTMKSKDLACQIRYGLKGEISVNEIIFNQEMPGIPQLTPLEIAEIITYVNNTWGVKKGMFDVKKTEKALSDCL